MNTAATIQDMQLTGQHFFLNGSPVPYSFVCLSASDFSCAAEFEPKGRAAEMLARQEANIEKIARLAVGEYADLDNGGGVTFLRVTRH